MSAPLPPWNLLQDVRPFSYVESVEPVRDGPLPRLRPVTCVMSSEREGQIIGCYTCYVDVGSHLFLLNPMEPTHILLGPRGPVAAAVIVAPTRRCLFCLFLLTPESLMVI